MRVRLALTTPCLLAAALTLAACSGGSGPGGGEELTWEDSPLSKALADFYGSMEEDPEEWEREEAERQRRVEEVTAACMAEEGFEYTPVVHDTGGGGVVVDDVDYESGEWAQQYGYGITTDPWADEQPVEPEEEWVDPNADYVESMSQAEQDAYYVALYGGDAVVEYEEGEEWVEEEPQEWNWEDGGCQGRAHHEVYEEGGSPEEEMWEDPAFTEFFEAAERLYEDATRDPRMTEINVEWAECMADAGVSGMTTPDEAATLLYEEWDKLYTAADALVDWEAIDWENVPVTFDPVRDAMDQEALAALKEREIATAVADHTCQEDLGTQSRYLEVQFEHEEEFIETYRAEIDALIATYGQAS